MKKCILWAVISLLSLTTMHAQVYLSKIYNDVLVLGPDNVAPHCDEIANSYVADIEGLYDVLVSEQNQLRIAVSAVQSLSNPTKAQLFRQGEHQSDIDQIEEELTVLMQFKELWLKIIDQTPVKLELVDAIRSGQCADIRTNHGDFSTTDYMVTMDKNIKKIKIVEHFPIEQRDSIPRWITKVSENCTSQDPNDCMMWCFVNEKGGDVLVDFTGDMYRLKGSKIGAHYDFLPASNFAKRELIIDLEGATIDIINVVKSDSNILLQLNGFSTVQCAN